MDKDLRARIVEAEDSDRAVLARVNLLAYHIERGLLFPGMDERNKNLHNLLNDLITAERLAAAAEALRAVRERMPIAFDQFVEADLDPMLQELAGGDERPQFSAPADLSPPLVIDRREAAEDNAGLIGHTILDVEEIEPRLNFSNPEVLRSGLLHLRWCIVENINVPHYRGYHLEVIDAALKLVPISPAPEAK